MRRLLSPSVRRLLRVAADAIAIADRHVEHPVRAEVDAAGNVATCFPRIGDEDLFDIAERRALQVAARDGERCPFGPSFGYDT